MTRRGVISGALLSATMADAQQDLTGIRSGTAIAGTNNSIGKPLLADGEVAHVICDNCGSDEIAHRMKRPPKPKDIRLSEWVNRPRVTTAFSIYTTTAMVAECRKCKFAVEYQQ